MKTTDMITRYLDGQTSPDEERQLRAMLEAKTTRTADERAVLDLLCLSFPEEDTAALITEELSPLKVHHSPFFTRRLAVVSGIAAAVVLAFLLWPERSEGPVIQSQIQSVITESAPTFDSPLQAPSSVPVVPSMTMVEDVPAPPHPIKPHIAQAVVPAVTIEPEVISITESPTLTEDITLARAAQTDLEYRNRLRTIEITTQAQAEQAFDAVVAAVLCSREPT